MIKIGILARKGYDDEDTKSFMIPEPNLRSVIIDHGGIPFVLLPQQSINYFERYKKLDKEEEERTIELLKMCDGIILPGGGSWTYLDEFAIDYAIKNEIPILGICLGMQIMGCEKDHQRNYKMETTSHQSKEQYVHEVKVKKDSKLYEILQKEEFQVNSRHSYTVQQPTTFDVVATSPDGVVEAIEKKNHPFCIGVQWHPEGLREDIVTQRLFTSFINACKKRKKDYN